jgi:hypothetical protein
LKANVCLATRRAPLSARTDPTVWFEDSHPVPEQEPLSSFFLQFSLWEATLAAVYQDSCDDLPMRLLPALESCLQGVPLRPLGGCVKCCR